jgi:hypothetical protein
MLVQFHFMLWANTCVQLFNRVLVLVDRLLAWGVDVVMCVFVRMSVLMGVGMHHAIRVPVFVGVYVCMDVCVRVVVLDLTCHRVFLLESGSGDDRQ